MGGDDELVKRCAWCRTEPARRRYCSTRCRVAAWRERQRYADVAGARDVLEPPVTVAALYVQAGGVYDGMHGLDPWPVERDATRYDGPGPVVAHPPCGPWGRYRAISGTRQRADLAVRAVDQVRWYGGVLEHPSGSRLWLARELPAPGEPPDPWGGWSLLVRQSWWGHAAPKPTWLYVVGRPPLDHPPLPPPVPDPGGRVERLSRRQREATPPRLATWLVELARGCSLVET